MKSCTLALILAMAPAASADLYLLEFTAVADFVGPITGDLTLDLNDFGSGSFLGSVDTTFGTAAADGTANFAPTLSSGALVGELDFGAFGTYDLVLNLFLGGGLGKLTGFDPGAGEEVTGDIFVSGWTITTIPTPGALALLGVAALGQRRRA